VLNYSIGTDSVMVTSTMEQIKTVAGKFKCYKYKFYIPNDRSYSIENYISPGIGTVFNRIMFDGIVQEYRLMDYNLE